MGCENVGRVWTPKSLEQYLSTIKKPEWCKAVTFHHTESPTLAQRPEGLQIRDIEIISKCYTRNACPHLFIDENKIFGMCDFRKKGYHASSFNNLAIGIFVLGNYDSEDPKNGRGLECWQTAAEAARLLLEWLEIGASEETILFHRDGPGEIGSCPGKKVEKDWVLNIIK